MERRNFIQGASVVAAMALATQAKAQSSAITGSFPAIATIAGLQAATSATLTQSQCIVLGYASDTDDGGGIFTVGATATANGGTIINDASGRSWYRNCNPSVVKAEWFGANANGSTDCTTAINAALASQASDIRVDLAPGTYVTSGSILISGNNKSLVGAAQGATVLSCNAAADPVICVANGYSFLLIKDLSVTHSAVPIAGGNGINSTGIVSQLKIENVTSSANMLGFLLVVTDFSFVKGCIAESNLSHGFYQTNSSSNSQSQWYYEDCLASENNGSGYVIIATSGAADITLGSFSRCYSFANSGYGFGAIGLTETPIQGVRIIDCLFGQDGNDEIHLDTYGGGHSVRNTFIELAGTNATGPSLEISASKAGYGICVSSNNMNVDITSCYINGHSYDGIYSAATTTNVTGCSIFNNGQAGFAGEQYGIHHTGGRLVVSGGCIGNTLPNSSQKYGVCTYNGANASIGFVDMTGNATGPTLAATGQSSLVTLGCLGT